MGCTDSKVDARVREKYATYLQDLRVVAAMETLQSTSPSAAPSRRPSFY